MGIDLKKYLKEFKKGTKKMFKEFFNKETNKKQRANMWTFSRLIISFIVPIICFITLFVTNTLPLLISTVSLTAFGSVTDYFDGKSARKYNSTSEYGKQLDQITDKIFSGMLAISLSILNPVFLISLLGEAVISSVNIVYKSNNPNLNISSTKMGRIKEWPLFFTLGLGYLSLLVPILNVITKIMIGTTFLLQVATASSYIIQNNKELEKIKYENNKKSITPLENKLDENEEKTKELTTNNKIEELKKLREELVNEKNIENNKVYRLK